MKKDTNKYPKGWNRKKVLEVIRHYENQSDDEAIAEDERAFRNRKYSVVAVPIELLPKVRAIISKHKRKVAAT